MNPVQSFAQKIGYSIFLIAITPLLPIVAIAWICRLLIPANNREIHPSETLQSNASISTKEILASPGIPTDSQIIMA